MADPTRKRLIEAFTERLRGIRLVNGYRTDAGQQVHLGVPAIGPDDPPLAIAVLIGDTTTTGGGHKFVALPLVAAALAKDDSPDPLLAAESLVADIKRAIEGGDPTFGALAKSIEPGEVEPFPREAGSNLVGALVSYVVRYVEKWGDPES